MAKLHCKIYQHHDVIAYQVPGQKWNDGEQNSRLCKKTGLAKLLLCKSLQANNTYFRGLENYLVSASTLLFGLNSPPHLQERWAFHIWKKQWPSLWAWLSDE
jgi:hypothetical protein